MDVSQITTKPKQAGERIALQAPEGWGKTSFAAMFPAPVFVQSPGETGLDTLVRHGQLKDVAHFPEPCKGYNDLLKVVASLYKQDHDYKTLVIDTSNGMDELIKAAVCDDMYGGDWGPTGFAGYGRGVASTMQYWGRLLDGLDLLVFERMMNVVHLFHSTIVTIKNPDGEDYDAHHPAIDRNKIWPLITGRCDMVLFGHYKTQYNMDANKKTKATGGRERAIITERTATIKAKHRHGLPPEIHCGASHVDAYQNFDSALKGQYKAPEAF